MREFGLYLSVFARTHACTQARTNTPPTHTHTCARILTQTCIQPHRNTNAHPLLKLAHYMRLTCIKIGALYARTEKGASVASLPIRAVLSGTIKMLFCPIPERDYQDVFLSFPWHGQSKCCSVLSLRGTIQMLFCLIHETDNPNMVLSYPRDGQSNCCFVLSLRRTMQLLFCAIHETDNPTAVLSYPSDGQSNGCSVLSLRRTIQLLFYPILSLRRTIQILCRRLVAYQALIFRFAVTTLKRRKQKNPHSKNK